MNKYLEKVAESSKGKDENKTNKTIAGGAAVVAGVGMAKDQYDRGHLTGRETLYHGTAVEHKKKILKEGLKPRASKGIIDVAEEVHGEDALKSKEHVFMTRSKHQAHTYANQAQRIHEGTFKIHDAMSRFKDMIPGTKSSKGVVHVNAPTWKSDEFKKVRNPEVKKIFKDMKGDPFTPPFAKKLQKKKIYDTLEKSVFTNKGPVSNKYMKGSDAYSKNSLGEIKSFIKAKPGRFAKGLGKSILGTALAGAGAYYSSKQLKK